MKPQDKVFWQQSPGKNVNAVILKVYKQKVRIATLEGEFQVNIAEIVGIEEPLTLWTNWTWCDGELIRAEVHNWKNREVCSDRGILETEIKNIKKVYLDYQLAKVNLAKLKHLPEQIKWCEERLILLGEIERVSDNSPNKCVDCNYSDPCGNSSSYCCLLFGKYFKEDQEACDRYKPRNTEGLTLTTGPSGMIYKFLQNKKAKDGTIKSYPAIGDAIREPENPDHWFWAFCYSQKVNGLWKTVKRSVSREKLMAVKTAIADKQPIEVILKLI
jgi:hypothetical protein